MLDTAALAEYTKGRLVADDSETERNLAAGLAVVQRWCGWHVAPVKEEHEVELDGPGGSLLRLPTLRVVELISVVEDGVTLNLGSLEWSKTGLVRKKSGAPWSSKLGAITVTMDHGFAEAADFESAVLSYVDRTSQAPTGGKPIAVGPFRWAEEKTVAGSAFSMAELSILDLYRLEPQP
ncbi:MULTISPECIES: hypothetical protein [Mycobacteroides]|uniref:hypothetical protein n=1 Tax=Mycobacteroides TaxID=670516 RepID=UPI000926D820|nr:MULTISPECIES: hypothetical protein [Mycobacteroides]SIN10111.1 Uncharacterised protein [Mycobacteroides abscessus subsp. abscessus]SIN13036.1 Uncharacterised protein [Mycobacteroides abscessus subsp. abscessus]SLD63043.1 Uncharacterised protein [Mycobacteroides abscessus subsp. abscessus]SLE74692.1 Uncharacterised protein [Mycobacteroides abscessus subsp. abscessus]